jgi:hypothetical protein
LQLKVHHWCRWQLTLVSNGKNLRIIFNLIFKFATGVVDTGGKFTAVVVDTGVTAGAPWLANISANFRKKF